MLFSAHHDYTSYQLSLPYISVLEQLAKTKLEITKAKESQVAVVVQQVPSVEEDPSVQQLASKEEAAVPKIKAKRKSSKSKAESTPSSDESVVAADAAALRADGPLPTTEEKPLISMLPIEAATIEEQLLADELKSFSALFKSDDISSSTADSKQQLPFELESINDELLAELQLLNEDWFLDDDASNEQLFAEEQSSFTQGGLLTEIDHTWSSEEEDIPLEETSGDVHTEVIDR